MRAIPTPQQVEARLLTADTGLRDRVIGAIEAAASTRDIKVKVQEAGADEIARVIRELERDWLVTGPGTFGGDDRPVLVLNPKATPAPKPIPETPKAPKPAAEKASGGASK